MTLLIKPFPVEKEFEKNPDICAEDVAKLRQWLETQPHLPAQHITDLDLVITYHCCERSAEVSKQVLDLHFTLRTLFTAFFKDRRLDAKVDSCLNYCLFAPLTTPAVHGYRAIYCRLLDPDPRIFFFHDVVRTFMMVFDLWQQAEGTWPGFVLMIDLDQTKLAHITKLEPMIVRQTLYFLQEAMLVKLKGVHFLNAPSFMDKLMMILKPFLKKKLLDIIHIHEIGSDTIYKFVPKEAFPKENGGDYKDYNSIKDETIKRFKDNEEFIELENRRRVNEALRPNGQKTVASLFGIEGSFKKLDID